MFAFILAAFIGQVPIDLDVIFPAEHRAAEVQGFPDAQFAPQVPARGWLGPSMSASPLTTDDAAGGQRISIEYYDWAFMQAQEGFVMETALTDNRRFLGTIPRGLALVMFDLGKPCYKCRDIASAKLRKIDASRARWLFWGMLIQDPEIRLRLRNVLRHHSSCRECTGRGVVHDEWNQVESCRTCRGTGHFWPIDDLDPARSR